MSSDTASPSRATSSRLDQADQAGGREDRDASTSEPDTSRKRRKRGKHVSRACDNCKARKSRCDGSEPICGPCVTKELECRYTKEDGRKTRLDEAAVRDKILSLIDLLGTRSNVPGGNEAQDAWNLLINSNRSGTTDIPMLQSGSNITQANYEPNITATATTAGLPSVPAAVMPPMQQNHMLQSPLQSTIQPAMSVNMPGMDRSSGMGVMSGQQDFVMPSAPINIPSGNNNLRNNGMEMPAAVTVGTSPSSIDRLRRTDPGAVLQFGPTSLWSYTRNSNTPALPFAPSLIELRAGDWVDWARNLPSELNITKGTHDTALATFAAYYASWCMVVDMAAFMRDLEVCNLVTRVPRDPAPPRRTANYSPLLHCAALYMGLHIGRAKWPETIAAMDAVADKHFAGLIMDETEHMYLSSPGGFTVYSSCLNRRKASAPSATGYVYFGMAFAATQALGLGLNCDHLVLSGQMSNDERNARYSTLWMMVQQDILRAMSTGRPAMLPEPAHVPYPYINMEIDNLLWYSVNPLKPNCSGNGFKSMASTIHHWFSRLTTLFRKVTETSLYSITGDAVNRDMRVIAIYRELQNWYRSQPVPQPLSYPLPHVLLLHMTYQLVLMYLFRPYYRSTLGGLEAPPSELCDAAAENTLLLLRCYENEHDIRNGPGTLIPVAFTTATIQMLNLVSETGGNQGMRQKLVETCNIMSLLAQTWTESQRGLEVINTLRTEWLIETGDDIANFPMADLTIPFGDQVEDMPRELHEWLLNADFMNL